MNANEKARLCGEFLARCLSYGWTKSDLDRLEEIWFKNEGWKYQKENSARTMQFRSDETIAENTRSETLKEVIEIIRGLPVYRMCVQDIINNIEAGME